MSNVNDKNGEPIKQGDHVYTPVRGGKHEGNVDKVVRNDVAAAEEDVKNPPKVIFTDQKGKPVAHNPDSLDRVEVRED